MFTTEALISLLTLTVLEIVLGIDNIIFLAIMAGKLPAKQQKSARLTGLSLAMITRVLLLLSLNWIMQLTAPIFTILENEISGRDLILIIGGLFLIYKSTREIHEKFESEDNHTKEKKSISYWSTIIQILLLDIVFSLDSVITAVGMASHVEVMIAAVVIAVIVMLFASDSISNFVNRHPSIKMLALSFLVMIGISLVAEGFERGIPKGYIYFAMAFSFLVELINIGSKKKSANQ